MTLAPLAYWVHDLNPFLIRFTDKIGIRYYGLAYVLGFVVAAWMCVRYARKGRSAVPAAKVNDLMMALIIGVLVGGRLGHYFLYDDWKSFPTDPFGVFKVWDGGMAFHGGLIGVMIALIWFSRANKIPFFHVSDVIASVTPVGLFFGRIANFINGELWGKVSHVPWAMIFPLSAPPGTPISMIPPRHPSQLYEAGMEGILLFAYMQWRFWKTPVVERSPGRLTGEFLVAYAIARSIGEIFREPDYGISPIMGLSRGTFYSLFMIVGGFGVIIYTILKEERSKKS